MSSALPRPVLCAMSIATKTTHSTKHILEKVPVEVSLLHPCNIRGQQGHLCASYLDLKVFHYILPFLAHPPS